MGLFKNKTRSVVGLDIEPGFVAAAEFSHNGKPVLMRAATTSLGPGLFHEGEVVDVDALADRLRAFFRDNDLPKKVRLGVASQKMAVRVLELPAIENEQELDAAIRFQAQEELPMPLEQAVLDHRLLERIEDEQGGRMRILVVAARRDSVEHLLAAARRAGLTPELVDLSAFAIIRALYVPETTRHIHSSSDPALTNGAAAVVEQPHEYLGEPEPAFEGQQDTAAAVEDALPAEDHTPGVVEEDAAFSPAPDEQPSVEIDPASAPAFDEQAGTAEAPHEEDALDDHHSFGSDFDLDDVTIDGVENADATTDGDAVSGEIASPDELAIPAGDTPSEDTPGEYDFGDPTGDRLDTSADLAEPGRDQSLGAAPAGGGSEDAAWEETPASSDSLGTVYCYVGGSTNLAIAVGRTCFFNRVLQYGLESMAATLAERRGLTLDHAREWLRHVGLERDVDRIEGEREIVEEAREVLQNGSRRIADEVRLSIEYYHSTVPNAPRVESAILAGPGIAITGLSTLLERELELPVESRSMGRIEVRPGALDGVDGAHLTVATGLALDEVTA